MEWVFGTFSKKYLPSVLNELSAMEGGGGLDRISPEGDLSSFLVGDRVAGKFPGSCSFVIGMRACCAGGRQLTLIYISAIIETCRPLDELLTKS